MAAVSSPRFRPYRRAGLAVLVVLGTYAALTATHLGEFWPFSINPMFSTAGRPWMRALAREVSETPSPAWQPVPLDALRAPQNGLTGFVRQTRRWTPDRRDRLLALLGTPLPDGRTLLLYRVDGRDGPVVTCTPVLFFTSTTLIENPTRCPDCPGTPRSVSGRVCCSSP